MNVKNFYNSNSNDFSNTRHSIWDVVKKFNRSINPKSNILDAGCGNGKNMVYLQNQGHNMTGIDFSDGLLEICKQKNLNVLGKIIHPIVRKKMKNFMKTNKNRKFVILDIPLFLENKLNTKKEIYTDLMII